MADYEQCIICNALQCSCFTKLHYLQVANAPSTSTIRTSFYVAGQSTNLAFPPTHNINKTNVFIESLQWISNSDWCARTLSQFTGTVSFGIRRKTELDFLFAEVSGSWVNHDWMAVSSGQEISTPHEATVCGS
jgi:hypothetical protein